jgi:prepilin-type N-terminal cleavage/methylation domain-containing protein
LQQKDEAVDCFRRGTASAGFTLIEIMAVMVIIGVLGAVAVKKINTISDTAAMRLLKAGITELNSRELLVWTDHKFGSRGAVSDSGIYGDLDTDLGGNYRWTAGPDITGGTLEFEAAALALTRTPATDLTAARWKP